MNQVRVGRKRSREKQETKETAINKLFSKSKSKLTSNNII